MTTTQRVAALLALCVTVSLEAGPQRNIDQGIAISFSATGEELAFTLEDTTTGAPLTGVRPAAWLALERKGECARKAATYLGGDLFQRADVDLNNYYVLSMNDDATISVVDPLFSFGGSKLLALLSLESRGEDWALTSDQSTVFVSMPDAHRVAVADTRRWVVTRSVATGPHPRRLVLGDALWVADDHGLTVIDAKTYAAEHIRFGRAHDVVLSADGRHVFAAGDGVIVVVDAHRRRIMRRFKLDAAHLAYSRASDLVYAADPDSGHIFALGAERGVTATIQARPGLAHIRFAPNGRHAVIANPLADLVQVLDAATNRIVQNGTIAGAPDRIAFSDLLTYVSRRDSEIVLMITLDQIGAEGQPLSLADFPGGQHPFGKGPRSIADSIVSSPEAPSVLVANAADKMIYLYKEGMAAPMGGFSTYGHKPRAVLVVDRGLRESEKGRYSTSIPSPGPGTYDVVFFLNAPRVITCFALTIAPQTGQPARPATRVAAIGPPSHLVSGKPARLRFALSDTSGDVTATDVRALAFQAPGVWQQRGAVTRLRNGEYELAFVPPSPGIYYIWLESESLGLVPTNDQFFVYEAK